MVLHIVITGIFFFFFFNKNTHYKFCITRPWNHFSHSLADTQKTAQDYLDQLLKQYFNKKKSQNYWKYSPKSCVCFMSALRCNYLHVPKAYLSMGEAVKFNSYFSHRLQSQDKPEKFTKWWNPFCKRQEVCNQPSSLWQINVIWTCYYIA